MGVTIVEDTKKLDALMRKLVGKPTRILYDGTSYGVFQEFGYRHASGKDVPAHAFMTPALKSIRPAYEKGWGQVIEGRVSMTPDDFVEKLARDAEGIAKDRAPYLTGNLKNSIGVCKPEEFSAR